MGIWLDLLFAADGCPGKYQGAILGGPRWVERENTLEATVSGLAFPVDPK
jgi:hypothetical protein